MKKTTIKDVAALACVSPSLVSRVTNAPLREDGTPDCAVHPQTARRILDAIRQLGYYPDKAAASLRKKMKKRIGVILPDLSNPFFADIARHFEDIAHKQGYVVLFGSSADKAERIRELSETFMEDGVDGIILTPGIRCEEVVTQMVQKGTPIILTIRDIPSLKGVGKILTDDRQGVHMAIDHLREQGCAHIEMLSSTLRLDTVCRREELFSEAMGKEARIHHVSPGDTEELQLVLESVLRRKVQALICPNASLPIACFQAMRDAGIRIPEDIALIGYDGGFIYQLLSPALTNIQYSRQDLAKKAFETLVKILADGNVPPPSYLPARLVAGGSTIRKAAAAPAAAAPTSSLLSALEQAESALAAVRQRLPEKL